VIVKFFCLEKTVTGWGRVIKRTSVRLRKENSQIPEYLLKTKERMTQMKAQAKEKGTLSTEGAPTQGGKLSQKGGSNERKQSRTHRTPKLKKLAKTKTVQNLGTIKDYSQENMRGKPTQRKGGRNGAEPDR